MKINKANLFAMALCAACLAAIVYAKITTTIPLIAIAVPTIGMIGLLSIFTSEFIVEIKNCKCGAHGTPTKPTIASMPKVPVPPKFKL
jgi:xanthosine utilization system XapX-like protein